MNTDMTSTKMTRSRTLFCSVTDDILFVFGVFYTMRGCLVFAGMWCTILTTNSWLCIVVNHMKTIVGITVHAVCKWCLALTVAVSAIVKLARHHPKMCHSWWICMTKIGTNACHETSEMADSICVGTDGSSRIGIWLSDSRSGSAKTNKSGIKQRRGVNLYQVCQNAKHV